MDSVVIHKSTVFAVRIVRLYKYLSNAKNEYVLSKQLLKSGTSIGANVREAAYAQSKSDFISKNSIALKEAAETEYWLYLLFVTDYLGANEYKSINDDCSEIIRLLTAIIKSAKQNAMYKNCVR